LRHEHSTKNNPPRVGRGGAFPGRHQRLGDKEKFNLAELYNSTSVSVSELIEAVEFALIEKNKGE
jgi:hypothetical protein